MTIKLTRRQVPENKITNTELDGILHDIFAARGIKDQSELDLRLANLLPISSLANTDSAAELILDKIQRNRKILIIADFDADGATACALMLRTLSQLNANVSYIVPNRARHGYGLSQELALEILQLKPELLITVDNGISSFEGIKIAHDHNIQVIVTDHHLPAAELPVADIIINPNLKNETFASKNLCGVGVAFYLACALHKKLQEINWYEQKNLEPLNLTSLLDLVALGTVADVVVLDKNNRILIKAGLGQIRSGKACDGINALFKITGNNPQYALASDLAFKIAPRINAAGRLEDMSIGIECLATNDMAKTLKLAAMLDQINIERRAIEQEMQAEAKQIVNGFHTDDNLPFGLCLYKKSWHEGIVGIVAGRLKDKLHRPTIVFAQSGGKFKGSARSVTKINIRDALESIDKMNPGLIDKFGGHAMAAGLMIAPDNFKDFTKAFDAVIRKELDEADLKGEIMSDGELAENEFTLEFANLLQNISPWGQSFPEPVFDGMFSVIDQRVVGEKHLKMILKPENCQVPLDAIAFNQKPLATSEKPIKMAYRLDVNRWQDNVSLQLIVVHIF